MIRLALLLVSTGWMLTGAQAVSVDFQHSGGSAASWDFLDLRGDAEVTPATDSSCPPGYGPEVLRIKGTLLLGMVKGLELTDGTIVALYRENDSRKFDADGIILFWSAYPQDIAEAHNTKQWLPHVWLEQDNDSGFQFRYAKENAEENTLAERSGYGIVTDPWNRTNWIWQKVQIEGNRARAKYWPAHLAEPEDWAIEAESNRPIGPRFGIKINSGDIHLAYLAARAGDIAVEPPKAWLYFPFPYATQTRTIPFTLFTNSPEASVESFTLTVKTDETGLESRPVRLELPQGPGEIHVVAVSPGGKPELQETVFALSAEPGAGTVTVTLTSSGGKFDAERRFEVRPATELQDQMDAVANAIRTLSGALATVEQRTERVAALEVIRDAAQVHLEHARTRLAAAKVEDADLSLRFAVGALAELNGYKGGWLDELAPGLVLSQFDRLETDTRGIGEAERGISDCYSNDYMIRFGRPQMIAKSFVMGRSYEVTIPWQVEGTSPDRDFAFSVRLVSPLGNRVVAQSSAAPAVPTSQWKPGEVYLQTVTLDVLPENPNPDGPPQAQPPVLDEMHRLLVTVSDPATGAQLLLGNPPGPQPDRPGSSYLVDNVYVSSSPFKIHQFSPEDDTVLAERNESVTVLNTGEAERSATILLSATSDTGRVIWQACESITVPPGESVAHSFRWTPRVAGRVTLEVRLLEGATQATMLTEAQRTIMLHPPTGQEVAIEKANHVEERDGRYVTPVVVNVGEAVQARWTVQVQADGRTAGEAATDGRSVAVDCEPWFGYYNVSVDCGEFSCEKQIIATVVERDGTDLLVNGEPFIVKGVNVHGMDGSSPERTASMMRIMRDLGFNAWRGDYPARWQIDLAYELNTVYTVLGPFSCTGTPEIFARQDGPPMATSRALSRAFAERYVDSAGVLLWNSCNEVGGETVDFLLSQYPVFRAVDPYDRPVHYANLYGQDFPQGQDVMGVNYYFGRGQRAVDRQPLIERSFDIAKKNGLPLIFCEFNSYVGAVHSTGVDAMRHMFVWGVEHGMAGGFQYMKGNSTSHPGVFDNGFNTHQIYDDAIIDAFADARVDLASSNSDTIHLRITNKRRCTLRQIRLNLEVSGVPVETPVLDDLEPQATVEFDLRVPDAASGPAHTIDGTLEFVTHFGFRCKVPVSLVGG